MYQLFGIKILNITKIKNIKVQTNDSKGGRGKMYQLFGNEMNEIIDELNDILAA
jgi:type I restriction enzyme R subunit